jgi:hypothetical protein
VYEEARRITLFVVVLALGFISVSSPYAQDFKQRAAEIQKWRTTFNDPDPTIRLAALEQITRNNKDPSLRALAIESTLKAGDSGVQAAAVLHLFIGMKSLNVAAVEKGPTLFLTIDAFDPFTGKFRAIGVWRPPAFGSQQCQGNLPTIQGQLTGSTIQFSDAVCAGTFKLEGTDFIGEVNISNQPPFKAKFPVQ